MADVAVHSRRRRRSPPMSLLRQPPSPLWLRSGLDSSVPQLLPACDTPLAILNQESVSAKPPTSMCKHRHHASLCQHTPTSRLELAVKDGPGWQAGTPSTLLLAGRCGFASQEEGGAWGWVGCVCVGGLAECVYIGGCWMSMCVHWGSWGSVCVCGMDSVCVCWMSVCVCISGLG